MMRAKFNPDEVRQAVTDHIAGKPRPQLPVLLTTEQVMEFLGVGRSTLTLWRATPGHRLRYLKIGHNVRYRQEDVEAFLEASAVSPGCKV